MPRNSEPNLENSQCGFRPGCRTTDQIFSHQQIFDKFWKHAKDVYACFVELEQAYDRHIREKLWGVSRAYSVDGHLLLATE